MSLKKSIFKIFSANFLTMISGIIISFLVPAIISVEMYSYIKTYAFYVSYISFFSLGFVDGMYIKYGGVKLEDIDKGELKFEHFIYVLIQLIFTFFIVIFSLIESNFIIFLMGISIIPMNIVGFYQIFYQAVGEFDKYAYISYIYTIINLILNMLLVFLFKSTSYIPYCLTSLLANIVVYLYLEYKFVSSFKKIKIKYNKLVWNNIKIGFFILLGNLSVMMFYAVDRWFIKIFYTVNDFAYYSFAISMLNIINLLISAISVTFYNYLSKGEDEEKIKELKRYFLILGCFASLGYFVLAGIVSIILKKYIPSLNIISISFAAYPYMIVINALYVNLYKARKDEKKYLKVVLLMVIISTVYNTVAMFLSKSPVSISVATTLSFITWYIYSIKDFKYLKTTKEEFIYLFINIIGFLILSNLVNWFIGGIIYFAIFIVTTYIIFKKDLIKQLNLMINVK
ncbi:lipopolysaccharide biosynthesis protein [Clostridium perfringens]|uniref:lipopolysaccharide biosynthesis protein n=1 Tax=Clostridium perfringens TaxID=1502 RepID=UPI003DA4931A